MCLCLQQVTCASKPPFPGAETPCLISSSFLFGHVGRPSGGDLTSHRPSFTKKHCLNTLGPEVGGLSPLESLRGGCAGRLRTPVWLKRTTSHRAPPCGPLLWRLWELGT